MSTFGYKRGGAHNFHPSRRRHPGPLSASASFPPSDSRVDGRTLVSSLSTSMPVARSDAALTPISAPLLLNSKPSPPVSPSDSSWKTNIALIVAAVTILFCLSVLLVAETSRELDVLDSTNSMINGVSAGDGYLFTHLVVLDKHCMSDVASDRRKKEKIWKALSVANQRAKVENIQVQVLVVMREGDEVSMVPSYAFVAFTRNYVALQRTSPVKHNNATKTFVGTEADEPYQGSIPYRVVEAFVEDGSQDEQRVTADQHIDVIKARNPVPIRPQDLDAHMQGLQEKMMKEASGSSAFDKSDGGEDAFADVVPIDAGVYLTVRHSFDTAISLGLGRHLVYTDFFATQDIAPEFYVNLVDELYTITERNRVNATAAELSKATTAGGGKATKGKAHTSTKKLTTEARAEVLLTTDAVYESGCSVRLDDQFIYAMVIPMSWLRNHDPIPADVMPSLGLWKWYAEYYSLKPKWNSKASTLHATDYIRHVPRQFRMFGEAEEKLSKRDVNRAKKEAIKQGIVNVRATAVLTPFGGAVIGHSNWDHGVACVLQTSRGESRFPTLTSIDGLFAAVPIADDDYDSTQADDYHVRQARMSSVLLDHFNSVDVIETLADSGVVFDPSRWLPASAIAFSSETAGPVAKQSLYRCFASRSTVDNAVLRPLADDGNVPSETEDDGDAADAAMRKAKEKEKEKEKNRRRKKRRRRKGEPSSDASEASMSVMAGSKYSQRYTYSSHPTVNSKGKRLTTTVPWVCGFLVGRDPSYLNQLYRACKPAESGTERASPIAPACAL